MKKLLLLVFIALASQSQATINQQLSDNLLTALEQAKSETWRTNGKAVTRSCITDLILKAKQNWNELTPDAQNAFKVFMSRPVLSGTEWFAITTHFFYHYTITGMDAVPSTDANLNGVSDYVDSIGIELENVWNYFSIAGYGMPPSDGNIGGNSLYDIYVADIGANIYAVVTPEQVIGNNPQSTTQTEATAATSFMVMNNTYSWAVGLSTSDAIKVTAAHEFFHAVQYGISSSNTNFLSEATATWAEDEVYPNIDKNLQYLGHIFNAPDIALNWNSNDLNMGQQYQNHWYGAWIFFRYLSEQYGSSIIRDIWNGTITDYEMGSINTQLQVFGSTFKNEYRRFLIACDILSDSPNYAPYTFDRALPYENYLQQHDSGGVYYEAGWIVYGFEGNQQSSTTIGNQRLMRLSADYFWVDGTIGAQFFPGFSFKLVPQNPANSQIKFLLLKFDTIAGTMDIENSFVNGDTIQINVANMANYTNYTAIIYRDDYNPFNQNNSLSEQYEVYVNMYYGANGIKNIASDNYLQVYPNPVNDIITVKSKERNLSYTVWNTLGKQVVEGITNSKTDVSTLAKGLYFVKGDSGNPVKFMKQ